MNILITGAQGFLGREFVRLFQNTKHNLMATNRTNLDVSNKLEVEQFFINNKVDVVLHTAFVGVKNNTNNSSEALMINLDMYRNLSSHASNFKLMFSFGSGAAFDRELDIEGISEFQIRNRYPIDFYGRAKNIVARHIVQHRDNIINLRLFGCFGPLEERTRLIKNSINRALKSEPIIIHQDKKMDFFYIDDLFKVIMFYIDNYKEDLPRDINMSYEEKFKLSDIAEHIKNLTDKDIDVIINKESLGAPYTGDPKRLQSLGINLKGLKQGINETYHYHRK